MDRQSHVAAWTAVGLALTGVVYAILMWFELGFLETWTFVRNDPGKFVFHLLLLPLAAGSLVWAFPLAAARRCLESGGATRVLVVGVAAVLVALAVAVGGYEAVDGFQTRRPTPTDIRQTTPFDTSIAARTAILDSWRELHAPDWRPIVPRPESQEPFSAERQKAYDTQLARVLGTKRDFWQQSSASAWWSALLNVTGILLIGAWAVTLLVVVLRLDIVADKARADLVIAFCAALAAAAIWFYLKIYSEWYINFFAVPASSLPPLVIALTAAVLLSVAAVFLQNAGKPLTWFARIAALAGVATGVAAYWKPALMRTLAEAYRSANDAAVAGLWFIAAFVVFVTALLMLRKTGAVQPGRHAPIQVVGEPDTRK